MNFMGAAASLTPWFPMPMVVIRVVCSAFYQYCIYTVKPWTASRELMSSGLAVCIMYTLCYVYMYCVCVCGRGLWEGIVWGEGAYAYHMSAKWNIFLGTCLLYICIFVFFFVFAIFHVCGTYCHFSALCLTSSHGFPKASLAQRAFKSGRPGWTVCQGRPDKEFQKGEKCVKWMLGGKKMLGENALRARL